MFIETPEFTTEENEIKAYYPPRNDTIFFDVNNESPIIQLALASIDHDYTSIDFAFYFNDYTVNYIESDPKLPGLSLIDLNSSYAVFNVTDLDSLQSLSNDFAGALILFNQSTVYDTLLMKLPSSYATGSSSPDIDLTETTKYDDYIFYFSQGNIYAITETGDDNELIVKISNNYISSISVNSGASEIYLNDNGCETYSVLTGDKISQLSSSYEYTFNRTTEFPLSAYSYSSSIKTNTPTSTISTNSSLNEFSFTSSTFISKYAYISSSRQSIRLQNTLTDSDELIYSVYNTYSDILDISISKDGTQLAFIEKEAYSYGYYSYDYIYIVYTYDLESEELTYVSISDENLPIAEVSFNAAGTKVCFTKDTDPSSYNIEYDVFVANADGSGNSTNITNTSTISEEHIDWN